MEPERQPARSAPPTSTRRDGPGDDATHRVPAHGGRTFYPLQGLAICLWWAGLFASPTMRAAFQFEGIPWPHFALFLAPDLLVIALGSFVAGCTPSMALRSALIGAYAYATLWCVAASFVTGSGFLGSAVMTLAGAANVVAVFGSRLFVRRPHQSPGRRAVETTVQSIVMWALFLFVMPGLILDAFGRPPPTLEFSMSMVLGAVAFCAFGLLGITSSVFMVRKGKGTPVPFNAASQLVISGPYRWVRNPMAIAGLGQGLAVALVCRSPEIAGYVLAGMLVWDSLVRPIEEQDLLARFGDEFRDYRRTVRCWVPRWSPPP